MKRGDLVDAMGRKGSVHRMNNAAVPDVPMAKGEPMPDRWRKSQDHFQRFTELIKQELDDETQLVEERWKTWTKQRLVVAGGETSGAVVEALRLNALSMGPEIDPGVPAMRAGSNLTIALKSGNFGADDFFEKAAAILAGGAK